MREVDSIEFGVFQMSNNTLVRMYLGSGKITRGLFDPLTICSRSSKLRSRLPRVKFFFHQLLLNVVRNILKYFLGGSRIFEILNPKKFPRGSEYQKFFISGVPILSQVSQLVTGVFTKGDEIFLAVSREKVSDFSKILR